MSRSREAREALGMTQARLAQASGVSLRTVKRVEAGSPPSPETASALCAVLGCSPADLVPRRPPPPDPMPRAMAAGLASSALAGVGGLHLALALRDAATFPWARWALLAAIVVELACGCHLVASSGAHRRARRLGAPTPRWVPGPTAAAVLAGTGQWLLPMSATLWVAQGHARGASAVILACLALPPAAVWLAAAGVARDHPRAREALTRLEPLLVGVVVALGATAALEGIPALALLSPIALLMITVLPEVGRMREGWSTVAMAAASLPLAGACPTLLAMGRPGAEVPTVAWLAPLLGSWLVAALALAAKRGPWASALYTADAPPR